MTTKTGILLVNLGTPAAPTTAAVKAFLSQFLHDQRVVDLPRYLWCPLLHFIILPTLSPKVAKLYQQVWTEQSSPLMVISQQQRAALEQEQELKREGVDVPVVLAMTYGSPSLDEGWQALKAQGVNRVILLPLYPQYAASTTAAVFDGWARVMKSPPEALAPPTQPTTTTTTTIIIIMNRGTSTPIRPPRPSRR